MEIGDWSAAPELVGIYRTIRDLGLETNVAELETFGFTVIENALSADLTDRLLAAVSAEAERKLGRSFDVTGEDDLEGVNLMSYLLFKDQAFEGAVLAPGPLALVTYLLGESARLSSVTSHFKGPGGFELPLHADNANGATAPLPPYSQVCNCNYALTDYTEKAGAFAVVPGSHREARQPTRPEMGLSDERRNKHAIAVDVPAGSAIVYHGNTWHGSFRRDIPGVRVNLAVFFCRQHIAPQENYKGNVPDDAWKRHADHPQFATLMGERAWYGWGDEGPQGDPGRSRAGRNWHA